MGGEGALFTTAASFFIDRRELLLSDKFWNGQQIGRTKEKCWCIIAGIFFVIYYFLLFCKTEGFNILILDWKRHGCRSFFHLFTYLQIVFLFLINLYL